ncbi:unnamed protein product [Malus baccata var. baccata]
MTRTLKIATAAAMSDAIDLSGDGGVLKKIVRRAKPDAIAPTQDLPLVDVHYEGILEETGEVFDTTHEDNTIFSFEIGKGSVIKAWDIAVKTMKVGEIAKITCKPEYAYGSAGSPPDIPPGELKKQRELVAANKEEEKKKREEAKAAAAARIQANIELSKSRPFKFICRDISVTAAGSGLASSVTLDASTAEDTPQGGGTLRTLHPSRSTYNFKDDMEDDIQSSLFALSDSTPAPSSKSEDSSVTLSEAWGCGIFCKYNHLRRPPFSFPSRIGK